MVKIARNLTLLSLLFVFVFFIGNNVIANERQRYSLIEIVSPNNNLNPDFLKEENNSGYGTTTAKVTVFNAKVSLNTDNDGDEYYPEVSWFIDIDSAEPTNIYVIIHIYDGDVDYWTIKSDIYTLMGSSPDEGVTTSSNYYFGFDKMTTERFVEVYYADGRLACTFGPDDDPDLGGIPIESQDYDIKGNPFATSIPTPTPAQTPTPTPPSIIGHTVDVDGNGISSAKAVLRKDGETIANVLSDENGDFEMENLEYGTYKLYVSKKGYRKKSLIFFLREETGTEEVTIKLKKR